MICYRCKEDKPEEEFPWRSKANGRRHTQCLECGRAYRKQWYKDNKEHHIAGVQRSKKARIEKARAWLKEYLLAHPCECGEKNIMYLDFHHRDGSKKDECVSVMSSYSGATTLERIIEEVAKCDVLCVKCHRDVHPIAWRL